MKKNDMVSLFACLVIMTSCGGRIRPLDQMAEDLPQAME